MNKPEHIVALAESAVIGGASAIRASGADNIRALRKRLSVPIIGIDKQIYSDSEVLITPTMKEVEGLVNAGSDLVALDATAQPRPNGANFASLYEKIRDMWGVPLIADISTFEEARAAQEIGIDMVATTLSGYTDYSPQQKEPDIELVRRIAQELDVPVIAEGRIASPQDVRAALEAGAFAVVVGTMITRPHLITQHFVKGLLTDVDNKVALALDIGGTKIAAGLVDTTGAILHRGRVQTPDGGGPQILEHSVQLLDILQNEYGREDISGIGISTGGQINVQGEIVGATEMIPNWVGFGLRQGIETKFDLPVAVINDGHAAALAEAKLGAGRGVSSMLCIVIGTGLGGGLIVNGELQPGVHGLAGSIGQLQVTLDGEEYLPLERVVSGPGLLSLYNQDVVKAGKASSAKEVSERAAAGEAHALKVIEQAGHYLGLGLSHALHTCDVERVVVGGSVAQIGEPLFAAARSSLAQYGHSSIVEIPVVPAAFGPDAGLIGAAMWVLALLQRRD